MFRRSKAEPVDTAPAQPVKEGGKGRPTPTRKEAEAAARARARAPRNRKELAQRQRQVRMEESKKVRAAMKSGDERYFLPRDQGPVRRFCRDFVDHRFSVVEMAVPLLIVGMVLGYSGQPSLMRASSLILLATVLFVVVDLIVLRFRVRRELSRRFPQESVRGTTFYTLTRALQMRFMRLPKPQVKIGQELPQTYR